MKLKDYFEGTKGISVLSTSDNKGEVDSAIYSRPHVLDNGNIAFIMADKLSHSNLQKNPKACFLFKEDGPGYKGKRLYLLKISETQNKEEVDRLRRAHRCKNDDDEGKVRFLVTFSITKELPLVGSNI
ncbi:MAG: pyridoxamine 5'-phosphate oxidase family protein [Candidatus Omnitrophica bacterium]|nr:pyridoxamine 5'-phosphate oxidase family protein [Candidatus Omnitrophota bacterium]